MASTTFAEPLKHNQNFCVPPARRGDHGTLLGYAITPAYYLLQGFHKMHH